MTFNVSAPWPLLSNHTTFRVKGCFFVLMSFTHVICAFVSSLYMIIYCTFEDDLLILTIIMNSDTFKYLVISSFFSIFLFFFGGGLWGFPTSHLGDRKARLNIAGLVSVVYLIGYKSVVFNMNWCFYLMCRKMVLFCICVTVYYCCFTIM